MPTSPTHTLFGSQGSGSAAILIHLGLRSPHSGLVFIAANCYAALSINDYPERWTTATTHAAQDKVRQGARAQLHQHWPA
jgi:GST-like protein